MEDEHPDRDSLLEWGVPERLLPFVDWPHPTWRIGQFPPVLSMPDQWETASDLDWDMIREAARCSVGIDFGTIVGVDLWQLREGLDSISSLWGWGEGNFDSSVQAIREMGGLLYLHAPRTDIDVDLSGLPSIMDALVQGSGMLSVSQAVGLRSLHVRADALPSSFSVVHTVEILGIEVPVVDLGALGDLGGVQVIEFVEMRKIDVAPLVGLQQLDHVKFLRCKSVTGMRALRKVPALRELIFVNVKDVDDPSVVLDLSLDRFRAEGTPAFDEAFAAEVSGRPGHWYVERSARKRANPLRIEQCSDDDRVEVVFDDWGWLASVLPDDIDMETIDSDVIEQVMRRALDDADPRWVAEALVEFDSEGDAVIVIASSSQFAEEVHKSIGRVFQSKLRVTRALRQVLASMGQG